MQECRIDQQIKEEEIPEVYQLIGHHRRHFKTEGSYKRIILNRQGTLKTDQKLISLKIVMICVIQTVMGPKNSCAEMSQNFRWQKTIVLIVIYILELVLS